MSPSPLRIIVLAVALAAMPSIVACGEGGGDEPGADEQQVAREIDRYFTQAELTPVDETDVNDAVEGADAKTAGDVEVDDVGEIDVDPS